LEKYFGNIPMPEESLAVADASESVEEVGPFLQLPAILDLKAAGKLAAAFLARRGMDVTVGAGEVQRLGGQCLQVLLSAQASWREDQHSMRFEAPSADLRSALELFGIAPDPLFQQEESVA
jgi:chemotaxis protein CheX